MRKILIVCIVVVMLFSLVFLYYYNRWKPLWELDDEREKYPIEHHSDATLRVVMIGDSWAEIHSALSMDDVLCSYLEVKLDCPVEVKSKGKSGKRSRGIYELMFNDDVFGTKPLLSAGANYCIVLGGINDASANLGTKQFCHYMRLIINFLLTNDIRPVIVEVPDVNIGKVFWRKPIRNLVIDYMRSLMTRCRIYHYAEYREALKTMLVENHLFEMVVYVDMDSWNICSPQLHKHLFLNDQIHLNREGYIQLDSAIASAIANDYLNRHINNDENLKYGN